MKTYLDNPEWQKNPTPKPGDIALVQFRDGFVYTFKCIVETVRDEGIEGFVEAVFDSNSQAEVTGHEAKGKKISFSRHNLFKVIEKQFK